MELCFLLFSEMSGLETLLCLGDKRQPSEADIILCSLDDGFSSVFDRHSNFLRQAVYHTNKVVQEPFPIPETVHL